jgi:hypothetical protein
MVRELLQPTARTCETETRVAIQMSPRTTQGIFRISINY